MGHALAAGNTKFRLEEIAHQWLGLAERRLAYYQELYRSGRWTLYYPTQERYASRMLDAIRAATTFRDISAKTKAQVDRVAELSKEETGVRPAA